MQIKNRQQVLVVMAIIVVALFAGDRLVLSPVMAAWNARAARIADLRKKLAQGDMLIKRQQDLRSRWDQMSHNALPNNTSTAEQQVFKAVDSWAQSSGVTISAITPQWKHDSDDYMTFECRVDAAGDLEPAHPVPLQHRAGPDGPAAGIGGIWRARQGRPTALAGRADERPRAYPPEPMNDMPDQKQMNPVSNAGVAGDPYHGSRVPNPKSEARNPKQIQMPKASRLKTPRGETVSVIRHLGFRRCFGFRISDFGFIPLLVAAAAILALALGGGIRAVAQEPNDEGYTNDAAAAEVLCATQRNDAIR